MSRIVRAAGWGMLLGALAACGRGSPAQTSRVTEPASATAPAQQPSLGGQGRAGSEARAAPAAPPAETPVVHGSDPDGGVTATLRPDGTVSAPPGSTWGSVERALDEAVIRYRRLQEEADEDVAEDAGPDEPIDTDPRSARRGRGLPFDPSFGATGDAAREGALADRPGGAIAVPVHGLAQPVLVRGVTPEDAPGLQLELEHGPARVRIHAVGVAWVVAHGCDAPLRWETDGWSIEPWRRALEALALLELDQPQITIHADDPVPAAAVVSFLAALATANLGPAHILENPPTRIRRLSHPWLPRHQAPTGAWDEGVAAGLCDGRRLPTEPLRGDPAQASDPGLTGLVLCSFLVHGFTNRGKGAYARVVSRGLRYLRTHQGEDGMFRPARGWDEGVAHAWATLAMVEAHGMTGSPVWGESARRALTALPAAYNRSREGDLALVLTAMCVRSAQLLEADRARRGHPPVLTIDKALVARLQRDLGAPQDPAQGDATDAAARLFAGLLLDADVGRQKAWRARVDALVLRLANDLAPSTTGAASRSGRADPVRLYLTALVVFQRGMATWGRMKQLLETHVLEARRREGSPCCVRGSWDPYPDARVPGGRVAATAFGLLATAPFYAWTKVFGLR